MAATAIGIRAKSELDELYRAHAAEVYRYVYAVLGNRADAEDVTQTTFVNALRALERGERPRKPANWLITIAHNLIRQRFRQQQSRPRQVELDRDVPSLQADDDGPSIEDLVRALQRIPESQREALVLREMEGRSYKEISAILDVSETALESLIFRARRSLAEELENLVTCDRAELALSQQTDGRLGRKERKRLVAHLEECPSCARVATLGLKRRRAFKGLAVLPLPFALTIFKGAPSASAAIGLPTIGGGAAAGTAAGVGASAVTAKIAIGVAAVAIAGRRGLRGREGGARAVDSRPAGESSAGYRRPGCLAAGRCGNEARLHEGKAHRRNAGSRQGPQRNSARSHEDAAQGEGPKRHGARSHEGDSQAKGEGEGETEAEDHTSPRPTTVARQQRVHAGPHKTAEDHAGRLANRRGSDRRHTDPERQSLGLTSTKGTAFGLHPPKTTAY